MTLLCGKRHHGRKIRRGEIRHTIRARRDLIDLLVRGADPAAADRLLRRIEAPIEILRRFPEAGRRRREIAPDAGVLVESPYLILYRLIPEGVQIVRVLHGTRHIGRVMFLTGLE